MPSEQYGIAVHPSASGKEISIGYGTVILRML